MDFPEASALLPHALRAAARIERLKRRCKRAGWAVIYANDHHGDWRSDFTQVVAHCASEDCAGAPLVRRLAPEPDDYFVLKPEQSAFHGTPLERLLQDLRVRRLVLCGIAADGCVLATAVDANMRGYRIDVPSDCVASATRARTTRALGLMRDSIRLGTSASRSLRLA
jgi:nicotinamidase-related amidase